MFDQFFNPYDPQQQLAYTQQMQQIAQDPEFVKQLAGSRTNEDRAAQLAEQQQLAQHIRGVPPSHSLGAGIANGLATGLQNGLNMYRSERAYRDRPGVMTNLQKVNEKAMDYQLAPYRTGGAFAPLQRQEPGRPDPVPPPPGPPVLGP